MGNITWVLVADGARARLFAREDHGARLAELHERTFTGSRLRSHDLGSDRPGRTFDSTGAGRHAKAPPTDPHEHAETEFLRSVVGWLNEQAQAGRFDELAIIAPPHALGELRVLLPKALARKVTVEIAHDLTRSDAIEVEAHLAERAPT